MSKMSGAKLATEASRWTVDEQDGTVIIVKRFGRDPVMVEHDGERWLCSECPPKAKTMQRCEHVVAAARSLPLDVALSLVKPSATRIITPERTPVETATEQTTVETLARGAEKRAARAATHDATHANLTSEVTVRAMTDEDRARLAARRAAKHKRLGRPDPDENAVRFTR